MIRWIPWDPWGLDGIGGLGSAAGNELRIGPGTVTVTVPFSGSNEFEIETDPMETGSGGTIGGGGGGGPQSPQNPQYPGCITANWFAGLKQIQDIFNDYWNRTQKSGKENGGWFFYEPKTNQIIGREKSEGEKSSMPKEVDEFKAEMEQFKKDGKSVIFMFDFHTHPLGSNYPSGGDVLNIDIPAKRGASIHAPTGGHAPIGIIISGSGKMSFFDKAGVLSPGHPRLNECL